MLAWAHDPSDRIVRLPVSIAPVAEAGNGGRSRRSIAMGAGTTLNDFIGDLVAASAWQPC
jgi:hypothetical protein